MKADRELDKEVTYKRCRECAVLFARMPFERRAWHSNFGNLVLRVR